MTASSPESFHTPATAAGLQAGHSTPWDAGRRLLHVEGWGLSCVDQGAGPPILCVHGNPTWSYLYRRIIRKFSETHRVLAPDQLGCGHSDKPEVCFTLEDRINHLLAVINQLGLSQITLLAHDWGGAIGLGALARKPELFSRVILCNTAAWPPSSIPTRIRLARIPILGRWAIQGWNGFQELAFRWATTQASGLSHADRQAYAAPYSTWHSRRAMWQFVQDIPGNRQHPSYATLEAIRQALPAIQLPTLLIWGMQDWCFTPACLARFQAVWPHAQVCRVPAGGHWVLEDAPELVEQAMRVFLAGDTSAQDAPFFPDSTHKPALAPKTFTTAGVPKESFAPRVTNLPAWLVGQELLTHFGWGQGS